MERSAKKRAKLTTDASLSTALRFGEDDKVVEAGAKSRSFAAVWKTISGKLTIPGAECAGESAAGKKTRPGI
jgi:hypothetical protein